MSASAAAAHPPAIADSAAAASEADYHLPTTEQLLQLLHSITQLPNAVTNCIASYLAVPRIVSEWDHNVIGSELELLLSIPAARQRIVSPEFAAVMQQRPHIRPWLDLCLQSIHDVKSTMIVQSAPPFNPTATVFHTEFYKKLCWHSPGAAEAATGHDNSLIHTASFKHEWTVIWAAERSGMLPTNMDRWCLLVGCNNPDCHFQRADIQHFDAHPPHMLFVDLGCCRQLSSHSYDSFAEWTQRRPTDQIPHFPLCVQMVSTAAKVCYQLIGVNMCRADGDHYNIRYDTTIQRYVTSADGDINLWDTARLQAECYGQTGSMTTAGKLVYQRL